jgi:GNAT superfamily N-acetyltransferase
MTFQTLIENYYQEAVNLLLLLDLDTKEEIEHHLNDMNAHIICLNGDELIGIIGWYKDNVNYANEAMGDLFPGEDAFWVGFFGIKEEYQKQGIGTELMRRMEDSITNKGAREWWVSSVPESREFYEKQGFKTVCTGEINGNRKFFMKKELK